MCIPIEYRSLRGDTADAIYDYIKEKTNLCKVVHDERLKKAFASRDGNLRKNIDKEQSFEVIWGTLNSLLAIPSLKWALEEFIYHTVPGGGFEMLLISLGLYKDIPKVSWTPTAKCNLLFYLGASVLDSVAMDGGR